MLTLRFNTNLFFLSCFLMGCVWAMFYSNAFAQGAPGCGLLTSLTSGFDCVDEIQTQAGVTDLGGGGVNEFIRLVIATVLSLVAVVALIVLIIGGIIYITSLGDPDRAKRAKLLILYAIIGLLLIGISAIFVNVVIGLYTT